MKKYALFILTIFIGISCASDNNSPKKLQQETSALSNNVEKFVSRNLKDIFDNLHPIYNSEVADTKYNIERFKELLQIPYSNDVKEIYAFYNQSEQTPLYLLSFYCDQSTAQKIIHTNNLKKQSNIEATPLDTIDFDWWNPKLKDDSMVYESKTSGRTKQFWFNEKLQKAHFCEFAN